MFIAFLLCALVSFICLVVSLFAFRRFWTIVGWTMLALFVVAMATTFVLLLRLTTA